MAATTSLPAAPASASSSSSSSAATASATSSSTSSKWTPEQDKLFENALARFEHESPSRWDDVASMVPGKTAADVKKHYELLVQDIRNVDAGLVPYPAYKDEQSVESASLKRTAVPSSPSSAYPHANGAGASQNGASGVSKSSKAQDQERRKGIPWSEDEHRAFLLGLEKFGKGDWRSISRNYVVTRTPTQVASHAQKYFIRLNSIHKDKRRTSIHDITSVNGDGRQATQGPITGQGGPAAVGSTAAGSSAATSAGGFASPVAAAVGTPITGYAGRRPVVPGTPMNVSHMAYPMPQPAMHH